MLNKRMELTLKLQNSKMQRPNCKAAARQAQCRPQEQGKIRRDPDDREILQISE